MDEERTSLEIVPTDEMLLQLSLVDFRTMKPILQKQFVTSILDDYCAQAKEGKFDEYFAGQMLTRTQLIASFLTPRKFKVISNG
jgi:hypothetical protein